ncbi:MAG: Slp family lipoprotein [Dokdonella sp.]|uniref:Slp family lipoprotein n=1 Tax=Dokdonella sp. TaxID=2291710 RepID=UPI0032651A4B
MNKQWAVLVCSAALASCASVPTPLQGQYAKTTPREVAGANGGGAVRWGGEIIKVEPKADTTCFEILGRPLDDRARPQSRDVNAGRFIACHAGFYDPEEFERGRELTITGAVTGTDHGKVGDFDYAYPHVAAETIYLWPKRTRVARSAYYDPWGYGFGYGGFGYGGFGYGPYWGNPYFGAPIIIREGGHRPQPTPSPAPQRK